MGFPGGGERSGLAWGPPYRLSYAMRAVSDCRVSWATAHWRVARSTAMVVHP